MWWETVEYLEGKDHVLYTFSTPRRAMLSLDAMGALRRANEDCGRDAVHYTTRRLLVVSSIAESWLGHGFWSRCCVAAANGVIRSSTGVAVTVMQQNRARASCLTFPNASTWARQCLSATTWVAESKTIHYGPHSEDGWSVTWTLHVNFHWILAFLSAGCWISLGQDIGFR